MGPGSQAAGVDAIFLGIFTQFQTPAISGKLMVVRKGSPGNGLELISGSGTPLAKESMHSPPINMTLRPFPATIRCVAIIVAAVFGGQRASAQAQTDPFVLMRGGAGNEMRSPFSQYPMMGQNATDWNYYTSYSTYARAREYDLAQSVFVPPVPPALGDALPKINFLSSEFAREIFHGGHSVASNLEKLSPKETERVAAYRVARQQLRDEIRAKFQELAGVTPAARQAGLAELAVRQAGRLRALADEAEALRNDLAWVNTIFRIYVNLPAGPFRLDPSEQKQRLNVVGYGPERTESSELPRMFVAAYFYAGLSTEQRLLLNEIGYGQAIGTRLDGQVARVADLARFTFLPATASFSLPASLPPALEEKISAFTQEKESLKSELRSAVLRDDFFFTSTRTRRLTALAEQQAPRFAALEALAEEIRGGLAALGDSSSLDQPGLSADLTERMGKFNARKVEARRELLNTLRQFRLNYPGESFDIARQGDGLAIVQTGANPQPVTGLKEFNADQASLYTALAGVSEVLRRDIQSYLDASPQHGKRTVDQLAGDFAKAYAARENRDRYRDYARAVLEPGLSAAQRRLLYGFALAELEQPVATPKP